MMQLIKQIDDMPGDVAINEGKIAIKANDREATLYISAPEVTPLSEHKPHLKLRIKGEEFASKVLLDREGVEALGEALAAVGDDFERTSNLDRRRDREDPDGDAGDEGSES